MASSSPLIVFFNDESDGTAPCRSVENQGAPVFATDAKVPIINVQKSALEHGDLDRGICADCRKIGDKICGRCKVVTYCSKECQRKHWKKHKALCTAVDVARDAVEV
jgi:hypothetical protein